MRTKATFLLGIGAGYVLGARAGRERYEQIVEMARDYWNRPEVQSTVEQAPGKLGSVVETAKQKVVDVRGGSDEGPTTGAGDLSASAATTDMGTSYDTADAAGADAQAGSNGRPSGGW